MGMFTIGPDWLRKDPCFYCGKPAGTWDHITPRADNGGTEDNLTRACRTCNGKKKDSSLLMYLVDMKMKNRYRQLFPISRKERKRRERCEVRAIEEGKIVEYP